VKVQWKGYEKVEGKKDGRMDGGKEVKWLFYGIVLGWMTISRLRLAKPAYLVVVLVDWKPKIEPLLYHLNYSFCNVLQIGSNYLVIINYFLNNCT
jgi:hypothetical protein